MPIASAVALTVLFWWPLYQGAGFIGGDLYPYFFPQKAFYADSLKAGCFPLWNDLSGFGYPVLGESQTGAAYPFHLVLYRFLDLNTAYNAEHLLHYLICFLSTWLFAKRVGLKDTGAGLVALVFTYGWFPPRACLEWAILTGAWMPVALWCLESWLQTRLWRYAIGLSFTIGLQLLAGHYHLAFITNLTVVTYAVYRLWAIDGPTATSCSQLNPRPCRKRTALCLALAIMAGAGLAAVQVAPTWELKQRSTRVITGGDYDPAYGQMPPIYVTQAVAPWMWFSPLAIGEENIVRDTAELLAPWHWFGPVTDPRRTSEPFDLDLALHRCSFATVSTGTNKVEAHFYCGLIPIGLAFCCVIGWLRAGRCATDHLQLASPTGDRGEFPHANDSSRTILQQTIGFWLLAGLFALVYATGVLLPIGRHLPGFSFFRGPGRYGIVTTLAIALLAGQQLDKFAKTTLNAALRWIVLIIVFASTCSDLWLVSRMVRYTVMVSPPRISYRESSAVRRLMRAEPGLPRLLSPGPNVGNLLDVSCVPWYQGIAPAEYVDPQFAMPPLPKPPAHKAPTPGSPELIEWLSRSGVTHVLNFDPLEEDSWHVELVWKGIDPFLNRVWAREEPIYLYRFHKDRSENATIPFSGRAYLSNESLGTVAINRDEQSQGIRRVKVDANHNSDSTLVVTELAFPGWTAEVGGARVETTKAGMFRAVNLPPGATEVTWTYRPASVYVGSIISLTTLLLLAALGHLRFWHPRWIDRMFGASKREQAPQ